MKAQEKKIKYTLIKFTLLEKLGFYFLKNSYL